MIQENKKSEVRSQNSEAGAVYARSFSASYSSDFWILTPDF